MLKCGMIRQMAPIVPSSPVMSWNHQIWVYQLKRRILMLAG